MGNKLNIYILILTIFALLVGWGVYRSVSDTESAVSQEEETNETNIKEGEELQTEETAIPVEIGGAEGNGEQVINILPLSDSSMSREEILKEDSPDLNRPIIILSEISPETQSIAEEKIGSLSAELIENPELNGAWLELAAYRKTIGDLSGAIEIWEFLTRHWDGQIPYKNLGMTYHYDLPDYPKSESYLNQAIEKDPTYLPSYTELFNLYHLSYVEKADQADDALLSGLSKNPGNILLLSKLGEYYTETGDTENTRTYYEQALAEAEKLGDEALATQLAELLNALQS